MNIDIKELKELLTLLNEDGVDGFMYVVFRGKNSASIREFGNIYPQNVQITKPLSDEVLNKAFDYYCETDEGVLRFDFDLRTEWKQEQLQRWKEAFRKAWD